MKPVADVGVGYLVAIDRIFLGFLPRSVSVFFSPAAIVLTIIAVMLFQGSEAGGETWGYWNFAQILAHKFEFVHPDRSPLACLYLVPFTILPYPLNINIEYFVTSAIFCFSVYNFLKRYGLIFSVATSILIFLKISALEPFTQHLALASILTGVTYRSNRRRDGTGYSPLIFYSFLVIAYLLRGTFILTIGLFVMYDLLQVIRAHLLENRWNIRRHFIGELGWKELALPCFLASIVAISMVRQSQHPWNNTWLVDIDWIPAGDTSLLNVGMIGHFNWVVGDLEPEGKKDIYFTHQKHFHGETNFLKIIVENPTFYYNFLRNNFERMKDAFYRLLGPSWLPAFVGLDFSALLFSSIFFSVCVLSVLSLSRIFDVETRLMSLSLILATGIVFFIFPKDRYISHHLIVVALGIVSLSVFVRLVRLPNSVKHTVSVVLPAAVYLFLFSSCAYNIVTMRNELVASFKTGFHVRQANSGSMKAHYGEFRKILEGCHGVMSLEHGFFAAFFYDRGLNSYSVFEIPPFGSFTESNYNGLDLQRIDCLVISNALAYGEGIGTTIRTRVRDFIIPFEAEMVAKGGQTVQIPNWGRIVTLKHI